MHAIRWWGFILLSALALQAHAAEPRWDGLTSDWLEGFHLGGYSSVQANLHPGGRAEASLEELSLLISWSGDSRWKFFSEIEIEQPVRWESGKGLTDQDSVLDVERLYFDYNINETFNLRAGRYLTPVGRWNLIHAAPLVWTTTRPLATRELFPVALNGLMLFGAVPFETRVLEYTVFAEALKDQQVDRDELEYRNTAGGRLNLTGRTEFGLSALEFNESTAGNQRYRLMGVDFLSRYAGWEISGELFQRWLTSGGDGGSGGYLQAVAPIAPRWFAVGRLENYKRAGDGSSDRWLIGAAWKVAPSRIVKVEYVGGDEERPDSPKGLLASFAILF
ncbi:hypothetical protein ED236_02175 [Pseudomethylobacillus aquaticus]|uniref:Porin n=1 Tax=Pseudomethylobacillus aquaticus TaxID=2676064 RepID=A0A3N0V6E5_9PROT|nr:hypothetical protein [Pseudomethylobacillus aquaticus]ROH88293.1 hypothetical protein ED236_02175 [Pseudomethylobacillus aquaticus]